MKVVLYERDLDFHEAFVATTHNPLVMKIVEAIWEMLKTAIARAVHSPTKDT